MEVVKLAGQQIVLPWQVYSAVGANQGNRIQFVAVLALIYL